MRSTLGGWVRTRGRFRQRKKLGTSTFQRGASGVGFCGAWLELHDAARAAHETHTSDAPCDCDADSDGSDRERGIL